MLPPDFGINQDGLPTIPVDELTPEEVMRLDMLRAYVRSQTDYLKRVVDERRLEFARWLMEQGQLHEDVLEME